VHGFDGSWEVKVEAVNAKLSEYAAAIALAGLDTFPVTRAGFQKVAEAYAAAFSGVEGVAMKPGCGRQWVATTAVVTLPARDAIESSLTAAGIGTRRWWHDGLHRHAAFLACPRLAVPVADRLAATTLGLPCFIDLAPEAIHRI